MAIQESHYVHFTAKEIRNRFGKRLVSVVTDTRPFFNNEWLVFLNFHKHRNDDSTNANQVLAKIQRLPSTPEGFAGSIDLSTLDIPTLANVSPLIKPCIANAAHLKTWISVRSNGIGWGFCAPKGEAPYIPRDARGRFCAAF